MIAARDGGQEKGGKDLRTFARVDERLPYCFVLTMYIDILTLDLLYGSCEQ